MIFERLLSLLGFFVFIGLLWLYSENRSKIDWRLVLGGIGLQLILGVLILGIPFLGISGFGGSFFIYINSLFIQVLEFSREGSMFIFGDLVDEAPFAFSILPTIIFF